MHSDLEQLEAHVAGTLAGPERDALLAHLSGCAECRDELTWLEQERALFARRAQAQGPVSPAVLSATERRVQSAAPPASPRQQPHWATRRRRVGLSLVGAAAAAALAVFGARTLHPAHPEQPTQVASAGTGTGTGAVTPPTRQDVHAARINEAEHAIDTAEAQYEKAAALLETEYAEGRGKLNPALAKKYDAMVADTKKGLAMARTHAGKDVSARVQVLDGYAAYVRSLQHAVYDIPEDH